MGLSQGRLYVDLTGAQGTWSEALTELLAHLGLSAVPGDVDPALVATELTVWTEGTWLVVEDELVFNVLEQLRAAGRAPRRVIGVLVFDSDVGMIDRYEPSGHTASAVVPPSGRSSARAPKPKVEPFADLLVEGSTAVELEAAFVARDVFAEESVERVLRLIGIPYDTFVPADAEVVRVTDGSTRELVDPSSPPSLHWASAGDMSCMFGVEGQPFVTRPFLLSVANMGGNADRLRVTVAGSAINDGLVAIDGLLFSVSPAQHDVLTYAFPPEDAVVTVVPADAYRAGNVDLAQWQQPEWSVRERFHFGLSGRRLRPGVGQLTLIVSDVDLRSRAEYSYDVWIEPREAAPRRAQGIVAGASGFQSWEAVRALNGEQCLAITATMRDAAAVGDFLTRALEGWAALVLDSAEGSKVAVSMVKGVRTLSRKEVGRGARWQHLADQLKGRGSVYLTLGEEPSRHPGPPTGQHEPVRSLFIRQTYRRDEVDRVFVSFDLRSVDKPDAWSTAERIAALGVAAGVVEQATITLCDFPLRGESRYETAIGLERVITRIELLFEPGRIMYLQQHLVAQMDPSLLRECFEVESLDELVCLRALPHVDRRMIENVTEPIQRT